MENHLVIRFGALGDLCICGWFLSGLKNSNPDSKITLVTKEIYSGLASEFDGVDNVITPDLSNIYTASRSIKFRKYSTVIDAHSVLRSYLITFLGCRLPNSRLKKGTLNRLSSISKARAGIEQKKLPTTHLLDRFCDLADNITPTAPLLHLGSKTNSDLIAIAPGAKWKTKQWPVNHYANLIQQLLDIGKQIRVFIGPQEMSWFPESKIDKIKNNNLEIIYNKPLLDVAKLLGQCSVTVTNDSGLLHLSEATGTPVVAIYGPTVKQFGYFPLLNNSKVIELDLNCRPCSKTGSKPCHRNDIICLTDIPVDSVLRAVGE